MNNENGFDKLKDFLDHSLSDNFHILEDEIDISIQMEYFDASKIAKENTNEEAILLEKELLFKDETDLETKKKLLNQLASINSVEAFRTIERYNKNPDEQLKNWAKLAMHESRIYIESKLLDQDQILISTGLGGKADRLRYFFVLLPKNKKFTVLQKDILQKEFYFSFEKNEAVIEELIFHDRFATLMTLIPIHAPIRDIVLSALEECNQFGDFLNDNFIVTNVKRLDENEIMDILSNGNKK